MGPRRQMGRRGDARRIVLEAIDRAKSDVPVTTGDTRATPGTKMHDRASG